MYLNSKRNNVDLDVVDSLCRIGQTAELIVTKLGTVTLQVVTSSSSIFSSVVERCLTTNIKHITFDLGDPYLTMSSRYYTYCTSYLALELS